MKEVSAIITNETVSKILASKENNNLPSVKRGNISRFLDICSIEKREDKGCKYFGLVVNYNEKSEVLEGGETKTTIETNFDDIVSFIGKQICADMLGTAINTKMQKFNSEALIRCKELHKDWLAKDDKAKYEAYKTELEKMVNEWTTREKSQKTMLAEMATLGQKLQTLKAGTEEYNKIMIELSMLAVSMANK
jgi:hypothetical protein